MTCLKGLRPVIEHSNLKLQILLEPYDLLKGILLGHLALVYILKSTEENFDHYSVGTALITTILSISL